MRNFVPKSVLAPCGFYLLTLLVLELTFGSYFSVDHPVGHDYSFYLPAMLDANYWRLNNGIFTPPWFTPAICAGFPAYADPQSFYYSPLQFLSFAFPPLIAAHLTLLIYASLGYLGMYLLCRHDFKTSMPAAILAASFWMMNGLITHRMIIGHVAFVGIALIPLIAHLLLTNASAWSRRYIYILTGSLLVVSWVHSALGAQLLPAGLSVWALICLAILRNASPRRIYANLIIAVVLVGALSASKLVAVASTMSNLPRSQYPLMGFGSVGDLLLANLAAIALPSAWVQPIAWARVQNAFVYLDVHEWALTLTPIPLILIGLAAITALRRKHFVRHTGAWYLHTALLCLLLIFPLAIQFYTPHWNAILKQMPLIKSISNPFRWTFIWLPIICATSAFALDGLLRSAGNRSFRTWSCTLIAYVSVCLFTFFEPQDFYRHQGYDPRPITEAFERMRAPGFKPHVGLLGAYVNENHEVETPINRNDLIAKGISQAFCYHPLLGYNLENFDPTGLSPGSLTAVHGDHLNMKNPICYVFPAENRCKPGDLFRTDQRDVADGIIDYHPVAFIRPAKQQIADAISIGSFAFALLLALFASVCLISSIRHAETRQ